MNQTQNDLSTLEKSLKYVFKNKDYLRQALIHSSYAHENSDIESNERMELLGDAVLHFVLTDYMMEAYSSDDEGQLSALRSYCESEPFLYERALELNIGSFISFGKGEQQSGGQHKESLLADTFEAVIAAVHMDGGIVEAANFVLTHLKEHISFVHENGLHIDSKSELQRLTQKYYRTLPEYAVIRETGAEHDKIFEVQVRVFTDSESLTAIGSGKNKKNAEKEAARVVLAVLSEA